MANYAPLTAGGGDGGGGGGGGGVGDEENGLKVARARKSTRIASLDVFRGLSIALMIFVDYSGSIFPSVVHSPWNGVRLADFVMPFFLFIVGISVSLVYKNTPNKFHATHNAFLRAAKLFLLGVLLQGGYFHGINSLTFGVDLEKIRWLGILQRISICYIVAALCEIWSPSIVSKGMGDGRFRNYYLHWIVIVLLSGVYLCLLYGLYVPDWQYNVQPSSGSPLSDSYVTKVVKCSVRGDLGPACNAAGMIDRYALGIEHLYLKPPYRNLKECSTSIDGQVLDVSPLWCLAPFDPEGILGSLVASVTCIIGLHFGHILFRLEDHKDRLLYWLLISVSAFSLGLFLHILGMPLNKQLYSISYMLLTTGSAGFTFCALYTLVDVIEHRWFTCLLEWMGRHSLSIFVLVASNVAIIVIQGFYWRNPKNNIVHFIVSLIIQN